MIASDHGNHSSYSKILFHFDQAILENKIPLLFLIIPYNEYDDKKLVLNENKTVLPYDLYKLFVKYSGNSLGEVKMGKEIFE